MQSDTQKDQIPKVTIALKAQIDNLEEKQWPNLQDLEAQLV